MHKQNLDIELWYHDTSYTENILGKCLEGAIMVDYYGHVEN